MPTANLTKHGVARVAHFLAEVTLILAAIVGCIRLRDVSFGNHATLTISKADSSLAIYSVCEIELALTFMVYLVAWSVRGRRPQLLMCAAVAGGTLLAASAVFTWPGFWLVLSYMALEVGALLLWRRRDYPSARPVQTPDGSLGEQVR